MFPEEHGYGVILADPAWSYANWTDTAHGSTKPHYDSMSFDDIAAIDASRWAAKDCLIALWTTVPKLDEGIDVLAMWGFGYLTCIPWLKVVEKEWQQECIRCGFEYATEKYWDVRRGIGFHAMATAELLLLGKRGKPKLKTREDTPLGLLTDEDPRIFYAPIGKHSEKPEGVQDWLERRYSGPYLELFARRERLGWDCLGFDTGWELGKFGARPYKKPRMEEIADGYIRFVID